MQSFSSNLYNIVDHTRRTFITGCLVRRLSCLGIILCFIVFISTVVRKIITNFLCVQTFFIFVWDLFRVFYLLLSQCLCLSKCSCLLLCYCMMMKQKETYLFYLSISILYYSCYYYCHDYHCYLNSYSSSKLYNNYTIPPYFSLISPISNFYSQHS